jgi:RluA family pseudouridine synthase
MNNFQHFIKAAQPIKKYFFTKGFRCVYPYYFYSESFAKGRWIGKDIKTILFDEFPEYRRKEMLQSINQGKLLINGKLTNLSYIIQASDIFGIFYHAHEEPVLNKTIDIIYQDENVLIINKPCGIPIHPCGNYCYNSLIYILEDIFSIKSSEVRTTHRLDRLTSGIVILPKNISMANNFSKAMREHKIQKEYLARVIGKFPSETMKVDKPILRKIKGTMECNENGKPSLTIFKKIHYDEKTNTTVVHCFPHTGRTHQIRVHLQWLGFPILNDPIYGPEEFIKTLDNSINEKIHISNFELSYIDSDCHLCQNQHIYPKMQQEMWLHAFSYEWENWKFKTDFPEWAKT